MQIKKANVEDSQEILDLQYQAYQSEAKLLNNPNIPPLKQTIDGVKEDYNKGIIWKVVMDDKIIGSVRAYIENDTVYIGKLMVSPAYQKQGIGSRLLRVVEEEYPKMRYELFTSTMSVGNIGLYQKAGYQVFKEQAVTDQLKFVYLEKSGGKCK